MSRRVGQVLRVVASQFGRRRFHRGENVLQTPVPASATLLPTTVIAALLLAQQFLQSNDQRQDQSDLADDQSLSSQQEQYAKGNGDQRRHFHGHTHHHHAHHLLHFTASLLHASFQFTGTGPRQPNLNVEAVQQRGDSIEQNLVENLVLAGRGSAQCGFQFGQGALRHLVRRSDQLEVLRQRQRAHSAQSFEERDRLLLQTG